MNDFGEVDLTQHKENERKGREPEMYIYSIVMRQRQNWLECMSTFVLVSFTGYIAMRRIYCLAKTDNYNRRRLVPGSCSRVMRHALMLDDQRTAASMRIVVENIRRRRGRTAQVPEI